MQYNKLGIRVTSRVAETLKTQDLGKVRNTGKISNLGGHIAQCALFLLEVNTLAISVKKHAKVDIKLFFSCPVLLNFSNFFQIFRTELSDETNFQSKLGPVSFIFHFFDIFNKNTKQISCIKVSSLMILRKHCFACQTQVKVDFRKLLTLLICSFLMEITFLSKISSFSKNVNHHWKCRE